MCAHNLLANLHQNLTTDRHKDIHTGAKLDAARLGVLLHPIAHLGVADDPAGNPSRNLAVDYRRTAIELHAHRCMLILRGAFGVPSQQEFAIVVILIDHLTRHGVPIDVHIVEVHIDRHLHTPLAAHTFGRLDLLDNHNLTVGRGIDELFIPLHHPIGLAEKVDEEDGTYYADILEGGLIYINAKVQSFIITYMDGEEKLSTSNYTTGGNEQLKEFPAKEGYNFVGWFTNAELTEAFGGLDYNNPSDITLYANYEAISNGSNGCGGAILTSLLGISLLGLGLFVSKKKRK